MMEADPRPPSSNAAWCAPSFLFLHLRRCRNEAMVTFTKLSPDIHAQTDATLTGSDGSMQLDGSSASNGMHSFGMSRSPRACLSVYSSALATHRKTCRRLPPCGPSACPWCSRQNLAPSARLHLAGFDAETLPQAKHTMRVEL